MKYLDEFVNQICILIDFFERYKCFGWHSLNDLVYIIAFGWFLIYDFNKFEHILYICLITFQLNMVTKFEISLQISLFAKIICLEGVRPIYLIRIKCDACIFEYQTENLYLLRVLQIHIFLMSVRYNLIGQYSLYIKFL